MRLEVLTKFECHNIYPRAYIALLNIKYLINEYTRLDIKSNLNAKFYATFVVESGDNFKSMTNIDF